MMAEGVKAVREAAKELGKPAPKLIAVTVLTSMDEAQWKPLNYAKPIGEEVLDLAALTKESGLDRGGCLSQRKRFNYPAALRERLPDRDAGGASGWAATNDQSRIATPAAAIASGSTHLVVVAGPLPKAEDKQEAVRKILEEMEGAWKE